MGTEPETPEVQSRSQTAVGTEARKREGSTYPECFSISVGQIAWVLGQADPQGPYGKVPVLGPVCPVWEQDGEAQPACFLPTLSSQGRDIRHNWPLTLHPDLALPKGPTAVTKVYNPPSRFKGRETEVQRRRPPHQSQARLHPPSKAPTPAQSVLGTQVEGKK